MRFFQGSLEDKMLRTSVLAMAILALAGLMPVATVSAATQTTTFSQTATFDNVKITVSGTITVDTTVKTLTGTIMLTAVNTTSGATIFSRAFSINLAFGTSNMFNFVLSIPAVSEMLAVSCSVTTGAAASCMVSQTPDLNHNGVVDIGDIAIMAFAYGSVRGASNYNPAADLNADGIINILDIALAASDYGAPVF